MQRINAKKINVLVYGSGAREHALADSFLNSPLLNKLYLAQTGSFKALGTVIEFSDYEDLGGKCAKLEIDLAVFGPEEPLCNGIVDIFKKYNIPCIGVNKEFSQLESSKIFAKVFMGNHKIKTARFEVLDGREKENALENSHLSFLDQSPVVIKADGLCGGKGVVIANNKKFAENTINEYLNGKFGENSKVILLEEFLKGDEISLISLWDGKTLLHFAPIRDFKRLNKSESAPNTGGMGAFCPVKIGAFEKKLDDYKKQLENALIKEKADFIGFIYSGLIMAKVDGVWDWHVLEYNVRLGDPEAQALLTHLKTDFLSILKAAVEQNLDKIKLEYKEETSACLTLACEGYPKDPKDGKKITLPNDYPSPYPLPQGAREKLLSKYAVIKIYMAGVEEKNGELYSKGGRVLSLCTTSKDPFWDLKNFAKTIQMEHKYFRNDIEIN